MANAQPDYYKLLGLSPVVTPDEIKKRYRELARRYHPDVNPSPEAANKIKLINEAYHILGDPDRRSVYDAERFLRERPVQPSRPPQTPPRPAPSTPPPPPNPGRPHANTQSHPFSERAGYDGFGRTAPDPFPSAQTHAAPRRSTASGARASSERSGTGRFNAVDRLVAEAQLAFINHRYNEAESLCQQALTIDYRNAVAHEILGDVWRKRGNWDNATSAYSYAVQFNPRNMSVQAKLERILERSGKPLAAGPTIVNTTPGWSRWMEGAGRERGLSILNLVLFLAFCGIFIGVALSPGMDSGEGVPINLLFTLIGQGLIAGILLAFNARMRPITEELLTREVKPDNRVSPITLGALLTMFALVWFYASLLVYIGTGVIRNKVSPSVLRVYGTVLVLIAGFAAFYKPESGLTSGPNGILIVTFAGNALFPAMLAGWAIGDVLRLRGRM